MCCAITQGIPFHPARIQPISHQQRPRRSSQTKCVCVGGVKDTEVTVTSSWQTNVFPKNTRFPLQKQIIWLSYKRVLAGWVSEKNFHPHPHQKISTYQVPQAWMAVSKRVWLRMNRKDVSQCWPGESVGKPRCCLSTFFFSDRSSDTWSFIQYTPPCSIPLQR